MPEDIEKVLEKARKLINLASKASTDHESYNANRALAKLLEKHGLNRLAVCSMFLDAACKKAGENFRYGKKREYLLGFMVDAMFPLDFHVSQRTTVEELMQIVTDTIKEG